MLPTDEQAKQFAIMLSAGLPADQALLYFTDENDPAELGKMLQAWLRSRAVRRAQLDLMKRPWQELSLDEKVSYALDQHYAQLAYLLFSSHYGAAASADKAKLDTARTALEAKQAGVAGRTDALSLFMEDMRAGRLKLVKPLAKES